MVVRTGRARSKSFRSAPTKIEMLPVAARWHPPETGPSIGAAPAAVTNSPIRRTSA